MLSVLIYILLWLLNISFDQCRALLSELNLLGAQMCNEWCYTMADEDDLSEILRDERGKHKYVKFYDWKSELEKVAKAYAMTQCI